ncbi:hypothetical protein [Paracoccus versutus]|uniref:Uncharacterized protein n=1 Tax=Paracoccus versutus TaxID=34007 RepID=A0A3D9XTW8_PARVE|nr:hypothetical protein [Paracoccus versutus]REF70369.1 hypothetical protein BDD41_3101 [Paracoccus versutus]REF72346.1 hypothetical protein BDD41_0816 [Paracoccus versutus]WGR55674.1 hypothetical protein E3U25_06760 [Paracoccus versutus]WGR57319.1 hypothetical protein E3U25_15060 [Paracoccus versutus]
MARFTDFIPMQKELRQTKADLAAARAEIERLTKAHDTVCGALAEAIKRAEKAETALEAYGREKALEGMQRAVDKIMDRINNTDFAMNYHAPLTSFCKSILAEMETLK